MSILMTILEIIKTIALVWIALCMPIAIEVRRYK